MRARPNLILALFTTILMLGGLFGYANAPAERTANGKPSAISVLTYNIHHGAGVDGKLDLERIAKVIRSSQADIVALQEVDRLAKRSGKVDQAAQLARLTGMHALFSRSIDLGSGQYGNAILSKFPLKKIEIIPLAPLPGLEARSALVAEIAPENAEAEPFLFIATHLHSSSREKVSRLAAVKEIERVMKRFGDRPAILAGDLNARPESEVIAEVLKTWRISGADNLAPTAPAPRPTAIIDYICYRPADRWKVLSHRVIDEPVASDHRPVLATIERQAR